MYSHGDTSQEAKCLGSAGITRGPITAISSGQSKPRQERPVTSCSDLFWYVCMTSGGALSEHYIFECCTPLIVGCTSKQSKYSTLYEIKLYMLALVTQIKYLNTETANILDLRNFYSSGSSFSHSFQGVTTADEFLEVWEQKTGYHTGTSN